MNLTQIVLFVIVALMLLAVAFGLGQLFEKSRKKRFGIKEAEISVSYVEGAAGEIYPFMSTFDTRMVRQVIAQAIIGAVVGLGYENKVAEDLAVASFSVSILNEETREKIASLQVLVSDREAELIKKRQIAALFSNI